MRFDLHLRSQVKSQVDALAMQMQAWEQVPRVSDEERQKIRSLITCFDHTTRNPGVTVAGVDGSGDYPALSYGDSFVYVTVAHGTAYAGTATDGLREVGLLPDPLVAFTWLTEEQQRRREAFDATFAALAGAPIEEVISQSDYAQLKAKASRKKATVATLVDHLIRPHASDSSNIGIQLRSTAELSVAARLLGTESPPNIVLVDTTLSLPTLSNPVQSLFFEHVKRWCCVLARKKSVVFAALSKSHGMPGIELIEELAREVQGLTPGRVAEHWFLRLPSQDIDGWEPSLTEGRSVPPFCAVSYLVRFTKDTPVLRLDLDRTHWDKAIQDASPERTQAKERTIMQHLDYTCHDLRCPGYPYPIKAAHDRASLTQAERVVLRKQIIDAAVRAGMKRTLFRDASQATGHG